MDSARGAAGVALRAWARGGLFADLDGDGWEDLVVFCDSDGRNQYRYSQLFRNEGDGSFTNVSAGSGLRAWLAVFGGATVGDIDLDGDLDLYLANQSGAPDAMWRKDGDAFVDVAEALGLQGPARTTAAGGVACAIGAVLGGQSDCGVDQYGAVYQLGRERHARQRQ